MVAEASFRAQRLGVRVSERVRVGRDVGPTIVNEVESEAHDLIVLGCYDHRAAGRLYLGTTAEVVRTQRSAPVVLLVAR